jgi:hypothetical protein
MRAQHKNTLITEESIKKLNEENHAREELNNELNKAIEKQVNIYLSSVSKREDRDQLSKPQLVSSHKKTWEWLSKVKQSNNPSVVIPDEFLKQDFDPILYDPNNSPQPDSTPSIPTSMLSGEDFVSNFLPQCLAEEGDMEVKQMRMKDWLLERQAKLSERDKMRAWMSENGFDEVSKNAQQYQSLHPHHTTTQWIEIYALKSNHLLSTNDLLRLYRAEVPSATRHEMTKTAPNTNNKQQLRWDRFNTTHTSNASNASSNTNNSNFNNDISLPNNRNNPNNTNFQSTHNNFK